MSGNLWTSLYVNSGAKGPTGAFLIRVAQAGARRPIENQTKTERGGGKDGGVPAAKRKA